MEEFEFANTIIKLIHSHQEGDYWDFKKEWYKNNGDLLHDIICMANNLNNNDAYIIIGVDEENDYCTLDISNDPNRKNTQNIVDFIKNKKFAGGVRPLVYVKSLSVLNSTIDVIVVENSFQTPFYLIERFEKVNANNIYTRIMDTNTPINNSADINHIEYLWKKRFHLDETPIEKIRYYLQSPEKWEDSPIEYDMTKYYKESPEYIIKEENEEDRDGYEFYLFSQCDSRPHWYNVTLYYHQTALEQFIAAGLDGSRLIVICPALSGIKFTQYHHWDISYRYYEKNTLRYDLLMFYHFDDIYDYEFSRFMKCALLFDSKREREEFEFYVTEHKEMYDNLYKTVDEELPYFPDLQGYNMEHFKKEYSDALVLQKMLSEFRNSNI